MNVKIKGEKKNEFYIKLYKLEKGWEMSRSSQMRMFFSVEFTGESFKTRLSDESEPGVKKKRGSVGKA